MAFRFFLYNDQSFLKQYIIMILDIAVMKLEKID